MSDTPDYQARCAELLKERDEILNFLRTEMEHQRVFQGSTVLEKIRGVIGEYNHRAVEAVSNAKSLRDQIMTDFRAIALILVTVSNADTHREKNSRLRGVTELLNGAAERLRRDNSDFLFSFYRDDVMQTDFPVREFKRRMDALERENAELKKALEPVKEASPI